MLKGAPRLNSGLETGIRTISGEEFALFQSVVSRESGIHLTDAKKQLLVGRLSRRLRELELSSFSDYYRRIISDASGAELRFMIDCICTNETQFFREPRQFEFLERTIIPEWRAQAAARQRSRRIRIWSAACSTGEEPFSVAMTLMHHLTPGAGWELEIIASDLSQRALEQARAGLWSIEKASQISPFLLREFMLRGTRSQQGKMKAGDELLSMVRFERINLNDEEYPLTGLFDLILCRNVLIYFSADSKARVMERLLNYLAPQGYIFLGHSESLSGMATRVRSVGPTIYTRIEDQNDSYPQRAAADGCSPAKRDGSCPSP